MPRNHVMCPFPANLIVDFSFQQAARVARVNWLLAVIATHTLYTLTHTHRHATQLFWQPQPYRKSSISASRGCQAGIIYLFKLLHIAGINRSGLNCKLNVAHPLQQQQQQQIELQQQWACKSTHDNLLNAATCRSASSSNSTQISSGFRVFNFVEARAPLDLITDYNL